jgi:nifR3 family TIM-barrel protein
MWEIDKSPYFVLAPMADVTDAAFRKLIAKHGKPDVMWTEFVSADGLFLGGRDALLKDLKYTEEERPIVAQFFSSNPVNMKKAGQLARELGFDGVDINMGCPDRSIEKQGSGAAHMKDYDRSVQIIEATKEGAGEIPVSVKTRVGYNKVEIEKWVPNILKTKPALLTIHLRTRKELSKVPANWDLLKDVIKLRDELSPDTLIFGNGDVSTLKEAEEKIVETKCDGVMIGRGIFGNPWFFNRQVDKENLSTEEILRVMIEHTKLFEEILPEKNFAIMKKHYKAYANGFDGAKELRVKLMEAETSMEVEKFVEEFVSIDK